MSKEGEKKGRHPNSLANLQRGNPGNSGNILGSALSRSQFKEKAREEATRRIGVLVGIIDNSDLKTRDRLAAFKMLAKYAGLEVDLVAQTDPEGNPVDVLDEEALYAIALAKMQAMGADPGTQG